MTFYLQIFPVHEPQDAGVDADGFALVAVNFRITKRRGGDTLKEAAAVLVNAGVGTWGTTIFGSSAAHLPTAVSHVVLTESGGVEPLATQNAVPPAYPRPGLQVMARGVAGDYAAARALAVAAYDALAAVVNTDVTAVP